MRPHPDEPVPGLRRLGEQRPQLGGGLFAVRLEAEAELGVGQPQLALRLVAHLAPGLQILDRHLELAREHSERLHRRLARTGLDARDVRVRDSRRGELALREPALESQALQSLPDGLRARCVGRHPFIFQARTPSVSGLVRPMAENVLTVLDTPGNTHRL